MKVKGLSGYVDSKTDCILQLMTTDDGSLSFFNFCALHKGALTPLELKKPDPFYAIFQKFHTSLYISFYFVRKSDYYEN